MPITRYDKALAGAITTLVVFVVSLFGLDLSGEVSTALTTVLTALAVYVVPNKVRTLEP